MHRALALLVLLTACGPGDGTTTYVRTTGDPPDDDDQGDDDTPPECDAPSLEISNDTGLTLTQIAYGTCDMQAGETHALGDLAPGETRTFELPAPGCYFLVIADAGACALEQPIQTDPLDACELFAITITDDQFICPGG